MEKQKIQDGVIARRDALSSPKQSPNGKEIASSGLDTAKEHAYSTLLAMTLHS
jgi:hypothetical protein